MTKTVVHVTTLGQWMSVLDVWFNQGFDWYNVGDGYMEERFNNGSRQLGLNVNGEYEISYWSKNGYIGDDLIEYSEFMSQQKEDNKMATVYEVSQSVFDELQRIKAHEGTSLIGAITLNAKLIKSIEVGNKAMLRYLADDPAIEFKSKEPLYRLWATDQYGDKVYFSLGGSIWERTATLNVDVVFTAPLEEIKKWQTPDWDIEKVEE